MRRTGLERGSQWEIRMGRETSQGWTGLGTRDKDTPPQLKETGPGPLGDTEGPRQTREGGRTETRGLGG